jgi:hypothetical protein
VSNQIECRDEIQTECLPEKWEIPYQTKEWDFRLPDPNPNFHPLPGCMLLCGLVGVVLLGFLIVVLVLVPPP